MTAVVAVSSVDRVSAARELRRLRLEVERLELTRRQRHEVDSALVAAADELAQAVPDARRVAGQLARSTTVLRSAGALDDRNAPLTRALDRLRLWLDPLPF